MFRAVALVVALSAAAHADDKPSASNDGKFTAKFPGTPKEQTQEAAGVTLRMFALEEKAGAYMVAYADMPIPGNETAKETEARLDGSRDGMVKNMGGKLTEEKKATLGKHPSREIFADLPALPDGKVRARVFIVGTRLYQVMVVGTKEFFEAKGAVAFLDSLELAK